MFSQDPAFCVEASRKGFSHDFDIDLGGVLGVRSAHILLFGRPGGQRVHVFWKSLFEPDFVYEK